MAFLTVVWVSRKRPGMKRLKVPTILDNIVKDATAYFLVIFGTQVLVECFVLFAPVSWIGPVLVLVPIIKKQVDLPSPTSKVREISIQKRKNGTHPPKPQL